MQFLKANNDWQVEPKNGTAEPEPRSTLNQNDDDDVLKGFKVENLGNF